MTRSAETTRALLEEASQLGAERALSKLGLADENAQGDIDELRELLGSGRQTLANMASRARSVTITDADVRLADACAAAAGDAP